MGSISNLVIGKLMHTEIYLTRHQDIEAYMYIEIAPIHATDIKTASINNTPNVRYISLKEIKPL